MSSIRMENIQCPGCARASEFKTWSSLNVSLEPDAKHRVISRELFQFKCPGCATVTDIVYPMLYHDMTQHLMIYLVPDAPDGTRQPAPEGVNPVMVAAMLDDGYRFRCVGTHNDLVEKILIFDAGLDDGPIEMVKIALRDKLPPDQSPADLGVYFSRKVPAEPAKLEFMLVTLDRGGSAEVPLEPIYSTMQRAWKRIAPQADQEGEWLRIDRSYVLRALDAPEA